MGTLICQEPVCTAGCVRWTLH